MDMHGTTTARLGLPRLAESGCSIERQPDETRVETIAARFTPSEAERRCPSGCPGHMESKQPVKMLVQDVPSGMAHRQIRLTYPALRCRHCLVSRWLRPDWLDVSRPMTSRLVTMIEHESHLHTLTEIALRTGVDERIIGLIFDEAARRWHPVAPPRAPRRIGIDEAHIGRIYRGVVVDLDTGHLIDILKGRSTEDFRAFFSSMEGADAVEVVAIDMTRAYEKVAREAFPNATLVVDRWHVTQKAREVLNSIREDVRKRVKPTAAAKLNDHRSLLHKRAYQLNATEQHDLDKLFRRHPDLGLAYGLKEGLFDIFDQKDPLTAERWLDKWVACVRMAEKMLPKFKAVAGMIENWREEILAYWRTGRTTNAMTENANGRLKRLHREGKTLSFERFRAKALYRMGARPHAGILASEIQWAMASLLNQGWTIGKIQDHLATNLPSNRQ